MAPTKSFLNYHAMPFALMECPLALCFSGHCYDAAVWKQPPQYNHPFIDKLCFFVEPIARHFLAYYWTCWFTHVSTILTDTCRHLLDTTPTHTHTHVPCTFLSNIDLLPAISNMDRTSPEIQGHEGQVPLCDLGFGPLSCFAPWYFVYS